MLGKLIKHELRATGRVMLPLFLALWASAVMANVSVRVLNRTDSTPLHTLGALFMIIFFVAIIAVVVMTFVVMVQRFHRNLLGDQGYLMFTLPVSVHSLIWSKIIVSAVWFVFTGLAEVLAVVIAAFNVEYVTGAIDFFRGVFSNITTYYALHGTAIFLETLAVIFLACAATCLMFYAAMSIGYSFSNHKALLSVVFYFVLYFAMQFAGVLVMLVVNAPGISIKISSAMTAVHLVMGLAAVCELICGAVFYIITSLMLKKRLNLG